MSESLQAIFMALGIVTTLVIGVSIVIITIEYFLDIRNSLRKIGDYFETASVLGDLEIEEDE